MFLRILASQMRDGWCLPGVISGHLPSHMAYHHSMQSIVTPLLSRSDLERRESECPGPSLAADLQSVSSQHLTATLTTLLSTLLTLNTCKFITSHNQLTISYWDSPHLPVLEDDIKQ